MKKLGFGCMRFPMHGAAVDVEEVKRMVDTFMERGFTYFDTSYVYHNGESESILKKVLVERYPRSSFTITTKSPVFLVGSQKQFFSVFQQQLDRLGTDYVDYYWLHAVNGELYQKIQSLNLVDALVQLKQDGKTRHIGLSYHDSPELLDQILTDHPELEYVQLGEKYGKSSVQIILRWHIQEGNIIFPKTTNPQHMKDNFNIFDFTLTDDEMNAIRKLDKGQRFFTMTLAEQEAHLGQFTPAD